MVSRNIKCLVAYYVKRFGTRNPFQIAENLEYYTNLEILVVKDAICTWKSIDTFS